MSCEADLGKGGDVLERIQYVACSRVKRMDVVGGSQTAQAVAC